MTKHNETIDAGADQHFGAYVSVPAKANGNAVIVLQEIFGVTPHIRAVADRFAEDGYLAYAPDLFWRFAPNISLTHSKEDIAKAMGYLHKYSDSDGLKDIASTAQHIRALSDFSGRVAVAGMCLGGKLAYLAAVSTSIDAAVSFYGVGIETQLHLVSALRCPLMLHFGDLDPYVPESARQAIADALHPQPSVTMHVYPGANHGFYTRGAAADVALARERTSSFLQNALA